MKSERILSLDIFRGWTILFMILVNNPGSWSYVYSPLEHAKWDGWTPTDLIFPFFLWISGFSIPLSIDKKTNAENKVFYAAILRRSLLLITLGLVLTGFPFGLLDLHIFTLHTWRIPGVLQRIGICYFTAAAVYHLGKEKLTIIISILFLLVYAMIIEFYYVPGHGYGILTIEGNAAGYFDAFLFGSHTWSGSPVPGFDPEGALSSLTAVVTMMSGILSYKLLKLEKSLKNIFIFFLSGITAASSGIMLDNVWPINKNLWSISYVFFTSGTAVCFYSIFYFIYDFQKIFIFYFLNSE